MSKVHKIEMTHELADAVLDALETAAFLTDDPLASEEYSATAAAILRQFDAQHREEARA